MRKSRSEWRRARNAQDAAKGVSIRRQFCAAITASILGLTGCGPVLGAELAREIVGTYEMNRGQSLDRLEIRANGSYVHTFRAPSSATVVDHGEWSLGDFGGAAVLFEDFRAWSRAERQALPPGSLLPQSGLWPVKVTRGLDGELVLVVDADLDWRYAHVPDPVSHEQGDQ